jgi:hypothetical protein
MGNLTARQQRFVEEMTVCGNAAEAARRAGYSARSAKVTACRMLTKANLQAAIATKKATLAERLELRKEDVLAGLLRCVQMGREQGEAATMIRGLVELGKLCGFYAGTEPKAPASTSGGKLMAKYEAMSEGELLAVIAGGTTTGSSNAKTTG